MHAHAGRALIYLVWQNASVVQWTVDNDSHRIYVYLRLLPHGNLNLVLFLTSRLTDADTRSNAHWYEEVHLVLLRVDAHTAGVVSEMKLLSIYFDSMGLGGPIRGR